MSWSPAAGFLHDFPYSCFTQSFQALMELLWAKPVYSWFTSLISWCQELFSGIHGGQVQAIKEILKNVFPFLSVINPDAGQHTVDVRGCEGCRHKVGIVWFSLLGFSVEYFDSPPGPWGDLSPSYWYVVQWRGFWSRVLGKFIGYSLMCTGLVLGSSLHLSAALCLLMLRSFIC